MGLGMIFRNRKEAGQQLGAALIEYAERPAHLVVGLARGGIIVAQQVALSLKLPLEVLVARKIGAPFQPEFAIGAIAGDVILLDPDTVKRVGVAEKDLAAIIEREKKEWLRREKLYRNGREKVPFHNRTILLIDDGIATGLTVRASVQYLKKCGVKSIVLAVPVASPESLGEMRKEVDRLVCLFTPDSFMSVGQFYREFEQVTDEEVCSALKSP